MMSVCCGQNDMCHDLIGTFLALSQQVQKLQQRHADHSRYQATILSYEALRCDQAENETLRTRQGHKGH